MHFHLIYILRICMTETPLYYPSYYSFFIGLFYACVQLHYFVCVLDCFIYIYYLLFIYI